MTNLERSNSGSLRLLIPQKFGFLRICSAIDLELVHSDRFPSIDFKPDIDIMSVKRT